jgi:hypothetical protein
VCCLRVAACSSSVVMGLIASPMGCPPTGFWTEDASRPAEDMLAEEAVVFEQDRIVESMVDQEMLDMMNVWCADGETPNGDHDTP